jgi:thymidylate kinase
MLPIVAIEGISFAGKTTLTENLKRHGFSRLYELADKFEHGRNFPAFPKNTADANASDQWFLQQEFQRCAEALALSHNAPVVADRSFISGLAWSYARENTYRIGNRTHQHKLTRKYLGSGNLFVPWCILLRMGIDEYFSRKERDFKKRVTRFGSEAVDNVTLSDREDEFVEHQIRYYDKTFGTGSRYVLDAHLRPEQLVDRAAVWIESLPKTIPDQNIEELLL